jgi:hypothetical protein
MGWKGRGYSWVREVWHLTVSELFSKLKSAEVNCGVTARLESSTDSHSLSLIGASGAKSNANASPGCTLCLPWCLCVDSRFPSIKSTCYILVWALNYN